MVGQRNACPTQTPWSQCPPDLEEETPEQRLLPQGNLKCSLCYESPLKKCQGRLDFIHFMRSKVTPVETSKGDPTSPPCSVDQEESVDISHTRDERKSWPIVEVVVWAFY